jgi:Mg2+-importing ATPase
MDKTHPDAYKGITSALAIEKREEYGENIIYQKKHLRPLVAFIKKFNSPLLLLLIGTATISAFLGQTTNATIILVMVLVSTILDYKNSAKSEAIAEKLIAQVSSTATIWRDGAKKEIEFKDIVPTDIIEFSAGDIIPADCRIVTADDFFINQSALTGESFPVEKHASVETSLLALPSLETPLSLDDTSLVFMGTSVVTGYGTAVVLRTGANSQFGKIAEKLSLADGETSFEKGIKNFSFYIMRITFVMVTVVFFINAYMGRPVIDSFLFAIAIAVGLTPELLPMIMSIALSRGSLIMAKKEVIVKNLSAIQNLGAMNILCTDKTGTLTEDRVSLMKCVDIDGKESAHALEVAYLSSIFHTAKKSILDEAIERYGNLDVSMYVKVDEVPFDFHRRRDSIVVDKGIERMMVAKGAPESILDVATFISLENGSVEPMTNERRSQAKAEYDRLSDDGFRVLALAQKSFPQEARLVYGREEEHEMVFIGFAAFLDPIKKSAAIALSELREKGVAVKIITGDSEVLTKRICKDLGIVITGVMTGHDMETFSDSELSIKIKETNIFARVSPEQKERIVILLRKDGNTVGYLGDGINDAPVLKAADVGISVNNAVDVAKETADIILLTKSLSVLRDGVVEGRKTFLNTLKYIKIGLSSNFGNMFSMMGASAFLPFLPMLPAQILLNNFLYDLSQTSLPTDKTDDEDAVRPVKWDMKYFTKYIGVFGILSSVFDVLTFYVLYKVFSLSAPGFQAGWFVESMATQVLIVYIIRTKRVPFWKSLPSRGVVVTTLSVVAIATLIPYTFLAGLMSFEAISLPVLGTISGIVLVYLVFGELVKASFYRRYPEAL